MTDLPICLHRNAVKVENLLDPDLTWHCWCPECDPDGLTLLPASFRFACCGGQPGNQPGDGHMYNCAGKAPRPQPQPRVVNPQPARTIRLKRHRTPRRPRVPRWVFTVVAPLAAITTAAIAFAAFTVPAPTPEAYSAADAQVCATWAAQGATVPEGEGGGSFDPGYTQFTNAEDALNVILTPDVNQTLALLIQNWQADGESSYNMTHGNWDFLNFPSDTAAITAWCKANRYTS